MKMTRTAKLLRTEAEVAAHLERFRAPDGNCLYCAKPADRYDPVGPIEIRISEPDSRHIGEFFDHEFCTWECLAHWAAGQAGGEFTGEIGLLDEAQRPVE
jgi:hypothetical protein